MDEPIVFFGTGPVAAASLRLLAQSFTIEAVITKPRQAHHRGEVPVVDAANQLDLPIVEVVSKKDVSATITPSRFTSRLAILIDFGIIIEQKVIDIFPLGIVNSHFSLLPQWRGADPITFAILSAQAKTGVSLMLLVEKMDEGPLLAIGETSLGPDTTTPELTSDLIGLSAALLKDTLPQYIAGRLAATPQAEVAESLGYSAMPTYSRKLTKEDGILDWRKAAEQLEREIRAYQEWPKSRTIIAGRTVIVTSAHVAAYEWEGPDESLGRPFVTPDKRIGMTCQEGILVIDRLKPAGKAEMSTEAFLNGYGKDLE